ncbi:TonB-dependent receptor family protein [Segetibacter aerophilus]|uniref:TonB-dependent receptor n=1 Tax=Segetibacter aerophilus TaxID=670293 RepID=A0A512BFU9_9BACT|nr:TonB-dependent receptor [Segetibacter aerophilus]GEO10755.1 TonB-dependent receptor [Segetibacter aerophilus]
MDSSQAKELDKVVIVTYISMNGIGHLKEIQRPFIYAGKRTEVIVIDSVDGNKAINNTRQILGRIPGLNIVESETGGFVSNGIGIRGLNPAQSLEMNVRQNGYNIAADIYGYNETYYLPSMEAVERIELIKGASSLQFGAQMGGMVNYVLKEGKNDKQFDYGTMQTVGSNGLFNTYHSFGGTIKNVNYFGFLNYRNLDGWRPNSLQKQLTGFGKISYRATEKLKLSLEYSLLRNKIKMPGGLTDEQFEQDSRASFRSRNWVKSPWNVVAASADYHFNENIFFQIKSTLLSGERSLVWFAKIPPEIDAIDPVTGGYGNREVDREIMKSSATELRFMHQRNEGKIKHTIAAGLRFNIANFQRKEEALGTNKADFDLTPQSEFEEKFNFSTVNFAPFFEDCIHLNDKFSITPGVRFEMLGSEVESEYEVGGVEIETEEEKGRQFLLFGLGLQYKIAGSSNIYANTSQAYRPIDYAQLVPLASASVVDPAIRDPKGFNTDIGIRGTVKSFLNYDIGLFYLAYNDRVGLLLKTDESGVPYTFRTNIAKSIHKGIESYIEVNITRGLKINKLLGDISVYNSFAYTDAHYTKGEFKGNKVEYAPEVINRIGLSYSKKWLSASIQLSNQSSAFADAANTIRSSNPIVGKIPGYTVVDLSSTFTWRKLKLKAGVNNIADKRYFTQRTDEYPGPGIISSIGRSFYTGIGLNLN